MDRPDGRLSVSDNGRSLVTEDSTPFFWLADTNLRLYKLADGEIRDYLDDRQSKQFNVIQGLILLHSDDDEQSTNAFGATNTDPDERDDDWFDHIDASSRKRMTATCRWR
jgi:hypothetical protein